MASKLTFDDMSNPIILFQMMTYYKEAAENAQKDFEQMERHALEWKRVANETYEELQQERQALVNMTRERAQAQRQLEVAQNTIRFLDSMMDTRMDVADLLAVDGLMELSTESALSSEPDTIDLTGDEEDIPEIIDLTMEED